MNIDKNKCPIPIIIFISLFLLIGIVLVALGVKNSFDFYTKTKNYKETTAYLSDYSLEKEQEYNSRKNQSTAATYKLIYNYTIDGKEYSISTNYSTSILPKIGSSTIIKCNPNDPSKAQLLTRNNNFPIIFIGGMFVMIPSLFLWIIFAPQKSKKNSSFDVLGFYVGFIFVFIGYGSLCIVAGEFSIKKIIEFYITSFSFPLVIPVLLLLAGLFVCIKTILVYFNFKK